MAGPRLEFLSPCPSRRQALAAVGQMLEGVGHPNALPRTTGLLYSCSGGRPAFAMGSCRPCAAPGGQGIRLPSGATDPGSAACLVQSPVVFALPPVPLRDMAHGQVFARKRFHGRQERPANGVASSNAGGPIVRSRISWSIPAPAAHLSGGFTALLWPPSCKPEWAHPAVAVRSPRGAHWLRIASSTRFGPGRAAWVFPARDTGHTLGARRNPGSIRAADIRQPPRRPATRRQIGCAAGGGDRPPRLARRCSARPTGTRTSRSSSACRPPPSSCTRRFPGRRAPATSTSTRATCRAGSAPGRPARRRRRRPRS